MLTRAQPGKASVDIRDRVVEAPPPPVTAPAPPSWREDFVAAVPGWLLVRVIVVGTLAGARAVVGNLAAVPEPIRRHVAQGLLGWDAERYVQIATSGYASLPRSELRFFPLLPLLTAAVDPLLPRGQGFALLTITNLSALVFGMLLHRLALVETGDTHLARRAAWYAAVFPAGFVFAWGYTEALWCALGAGALLAVRRDRWWLAVVLGLAAGLLRPVGLLLAIPLAVEGVRALRAGTAGSPRGRGRIVAAIASPCVGTLAYLTWVGRTFGDPRLPFAIQQTAAFRGPATDPLRAVWRPAAALLRGQVTLESVRVLWAVGLVALVVVLWRRWPRSHAAFATAVVVVALSTSRLGSFERYTFTAFPIALALATVSARPAADRVLLAAGGSFLGVYSLLALLGAYVP